MRRFSPFFLSGALFLCCCAPQNTTPAQAKTLAYWRFEGGRHSRPLEGRDALRDQSGAGNTLRSSGDFSKPVETADVALSLVPNTGSPNRSSAEFRGNDELFSHGTSLDSADLGPAGSNGWTIEFSVRLESFDGIAHLMSRGGGTPGGEKKSPLLFTANNPDGNDNYSLRLEILDGAGEARRIATPTKLQARRWYNVAASGSSGELKLYIDSLDGRGYQLAGSQPLRGALSAALGRFALGRGWSGGPDTWMNGRLDEVRISDRALEPAQFLFSTSMGVGVKAQPTQTPPPRDLKLLYGADPHVSATGNGFTLYPTGRSSRDGNWFFYAYSSPDLKNWTRTGPILNFKDIPWIYADGNPRHYPWAPALEQKNGKFYFYYSVGDQSSTPSRVGVAVADTPLGPFKDSGQPLVTGGNGFEAIDPMAFTDPKTNKSYLYVGGSNGSKLRVWLLSDDMLHVVREEPVAQPPKFTEGAFMHYANGRYYLSYSHGGWRSPSYSVHYVTSTSPLGPWTYHGPILVSDQTRKGPGHHGFVQDPKDGRWYIAYHRWHSAKAGGDPFTTPGGRSIAIAPVSYEKNGEITPIQMDDNVPVLHEAQAGR
jgi:hypothetical protein